MVYSAKDLNLKLQGDVDNLKNYMFAVVVVLVVAVVTMLFTVFGIIQQYLTNEAATYQTLIDKVNTTNTKIDSLLRESGNPASTPIKK